MLHAQEAHVVQRGVVLALKLEREKEVLLRLDLVPLGPLHDADVGEGLHAIWIDLEREEVLLDGAFGMPSHHLQVAEFHHGRSVLGVHREAAVEARLALYEVPLAEVYHPEIEVGVERTLFHRRARLEPVLGVQDASHLDGDERQIIHRLVVLGFLVERSGEGFLRALEVILTHANVAEILMRHREGGIATNR